MSDPEQVTGIGTWNQNARLLMREIESMHGDIRSLRKEVRSLEKGQIKLKMTLAITGAGGAGVGGTMVAVIERMLS